MIPYHESRDAAKIAALAASLETNGWLGMPLVTWGDCALTGAHRLAAVEVLERQDRASIAIPTIEIETLAEIAGTDWDAICAEVACDGIDSPNLIEALDRALTQQQRDAYGIDIH